MAIDRLTLGTAQLGTSYGVASHGRRLSAREARAILDAALDLDVTSLDTAAAYGEAETRIGDFLKQQKRSDAFAICTKLPPLGDDPTDSDLSRLVAVEVESSLQRLGLETIDTYLVHDSGDLARHGARLVDALLEQRARGRIRTLGISAYSPVEGALVEQHSALTVLQHPLSILDRRLLHQNRLARLSARGVAVHARSIFLQGLITMGPDELPSGLAIARDSLLKLERVLRRFAVEPIHAALPFALATGVDRVVIGVDEPGQLVEAVEAVSRPLPEGLVETLEEELSDVPAEVLDPRRWAL